MTDTATPIVNKTDATLIEQGENENMPMVDTTSEDTLLHQQLNIDEKPLDLFKKSKKKVAFKIEEKITLSENLESNKIQSDEIPISDQVLDTKVVDINEDLDIPENIQNSLDVTTLPLEVEKEISKHKNVTKIRKKKKSSAQKKDYEEWVEPEYTPPVLEPMPEKIQWEPKKTKEKSKKLPALQKLVPSKIERTEIQSTKLEYVQPSEKIQFADIKLKKTTTPKKKESEIVQIPKIRLRSRITFVSDWPTLLQIPIITLLEENPIQNGILSRNAEEAEEILTKKFKKKKLPEQEVTVLEKLDKDLEDLKKIPLEEIEDKSIYQRPKKEPREKSLEKKVVLEKGKGKIPEKKEERTDVKLQKIPSKKEHGVNEAEKKIEPVELIDSETRRESIETGGPLKLKPFKPIDDSDTNIEKLVADDMDEEKQKLPDDDAKKYKRPSKKKVTQDTEQIPLEKGTPKTEPQKSDDDIRFKIPSPTKTEDTQDKPILKPFKKKSLTEQALPSKDDNIEFNVVPKKIDDKTKSKKIKPIKDSLEQTSDQLLAETNKTTKHVETSEEMEKESKTEKNIPLEDLLTEKKTVSREKLDLENENSPKKTKKKKTSSKKDYEEWVEPEYTPPVLEPMPEKIQWEPKKTKEKSKKLPALQKLVPSKIERTEIQSTKLEYVQPSEKIQFADIKLKKTTTPKKKESEIVQIPKIRLRSRITFVSDWPTLLQIPIITLLEENPIQNGILSRNAEEAEEILTKKFKKKKLPEQEVTVLEKLDKDLEDLKKLPLEEIEDKSIYQRPKKEPREKSLEKKVVLEKGKGKIPEKKEERKDVKLQKIPSKKEHGVDEAEKKIEPVELIDSETRRESIETGGPLKLKPFKPIDDSDTNIEKLVADDMDEEKQKLPDDDAKKYKRPSKKKVTQDTEQIPLEKGTPKTEPQKSDDDVRFKIPSPTKTEDTQDKPILKPFTKNTISETLDEKVLNDRPIKNIEEKDSLKEQIDLMLPHETEQLKEKSKLKDTTEVQIGKKHKKKETAQDVTQLESAAPLTKKPQIEEITADVALKKKHKKKSIDASPDELVVEKPSAGLAEDIEVEDVTEVQVRKKPKKKQSVDITALDVTLSQPAEPLTEVTQLEEVTADVALKKKPKKKPADESSDESVVKKPRVVKAEEIEVEDDTEVQVRKKHKKKPSIGETALDVTLSQPAEPSTEETRLEEVNTDVALKKKHKSKPVDTSSDELVVKKPSVVEEVGIEIDNTAEEQVCKKPKKKSSVDETAVDVMLSQPAEPLTEVTRLEKETTEVALKKKSKKKPDDTSSGELEVEKPSVVEEVGIEIDDTTEELVRQKRKKKSSVDETAVEVMLSQPAAPPTEVPQLEEVTTDVALKKKPKKKLADESSDELVVKKPSAVLTEDIEVEDVTEVQVRKKPKKKQSVDITALDVTLSQPVEPLTEVTQLEEVTADVALKKKPKKKPADESSDELVVKKPSVDKAEEIEVEDVTDVQVRKKPKKKQSVDIRAIDVALSQPAEPLSEVTQLEEVSADVTLKKKPKKEPADRDSDELVVEKPSVVLAEDIEVEDVTEVEIRKKHKKKPTAKETAVDVTLSQPAEPSTEVTQHEEVTADVALKKKPKKQPVDEFSDELVVKKPSVVKAEEIEVEDVTEVQVHKKPKKKQSVDITAVDVTLSQPAEPLTEVTQLEKVTADVALKKKPKKKPSANETAVDVTLPQPAEPLTEVPQLEEVTADVALKKKPKKKPADESSDELVVEKPSAVLAEDIEVEDVTEVQVRKKPKKKQSVNITALDVTLSQPAEPLTEVTQLEEVTADVALKKKPKKKPADESSDELVVKKPSVFLAEDIEVEDVTEVEIRKKPKKKPSVEESMVDVTLPQPAEPSTEVTQLEEATANVALKKKPKKELADESSDELVVKKPSVVEAEEIKVEDVTEVQVRKKPKKKPFVDETAVDVTLSQPAEPLTEVIQLEDVTADVALKKKPKKKPADESSDELVVKKPSVVLAEDIEVEDVTEVEIRKKPKKKPSIEESMVDVTLPQPAEPSTEVTQHEEVTADVALKKKPKKQAVDEFSDELVVKKPSVVKAEEFEVEDVTEVQVRKKPKKKQSVDITAVDVTLSQPAEPLTEVTQLEEVTADVALKKKPKKKPADESSDELVVKKPSVVLAEDIEVEDVTEVEIRKKPKKKPSVEESIVDVMLPQPAEPSTEVTELEEVTADVALKKKPKKKPADESSDELVVKKPSVVLAEDIEVEDVTEVQFRKKPKQKPSVEESIVDVTLPQPAEPSTKEIQLEVVTADVALKKKSRKKHIDEYSDELMVKKLSVVESRESETEINADTFEETVFTDDVHEFLLPRKPPSLPPKPIEEIYEDVTIKKLRPRKKLPSDIKEFTDIESVTFKPRTTKTKEDVEQEFKISLNTYEEEDISMSRKVKLKQKKKELTYSEETDEETIKIMSPFNLDEEEYNIQELETDEFNLPLKSRKIKKINQPYLVEDVSDDIQLSLKSKRKYSREEADESLAIKVKRKIGDSTYEEEEATLSITKEEDVPEDEIECAVHEGDIMISICSYVAETNEAINLVEGEKVSIIEHTNTDWWFVKKNINQEKGWVPAQYLLNEAQYTIYLQRKLHEKIDKLPIFEKAALGERLSAPRFIEKLQPIHTPDGYTVQFECQVEGVPRPQITWFRQTAIIKPSQDFQMFYDDDNVATLIIKEVFPEDAGTFTCVAKNMAGFASSTTELTVEIPGSDHASDITILSRKSLSRESSLADILEGIPPTFSRQPKAKCVKDGDNVILDCRLVAVPEPEITWLYNDKKIITKDNIIVVTESDMHMYCSVIKITKVSKEQEGKYTIVAKNREGESMIEIPLKVQTGNREPPEILEPLKPLAVREGESVVLSTQIVGNPNPTMKWLKNNKPLEEITPRFDGNVTTLTLIQPKILDSGEYSVVATNELGMAETKANLTVEAAATLDVALSLAIELAKEEYTAHLQKEMPSGAPEPPLFVERFQELTVPEKEQFTLTARVTGNPVPEVTWLRNNKPLPKSPNIVESYDGETITLEIKNADSEIDAGDYKCVAVNPVGKTSHGAKVTVDVEKVYFVKKLDRRKSIDEYRSLELACEASHTVSTTWWHNDQEISGMDHREIIQEGKVHKLVIKHISQQDEGTYKCTVKNQKTFCDVTVKPTKPEFLRKLQDSEFIEKNEAILEVEISSQVANVSWFKDGEPLSQSSEKLTFIKEGTIRKLLIRSASIQDEGEYTCALADEKCSAEVTIIELPPEIITKMQNLTVARGEKAIFEIELTKGDALVRWFKDNQELQFSENIQLLIDGKRQKLKVINADLSDAGIYSCEVGDQTASANLTVEEPGVTFLKRLPEITLVQLNEDAIFEIEISNPNILVVWLRKGQEIHESSKYEIIDEGKKKILKIKNCTVEDALEYSVIATNVESSSKLKVEVIEAPPVISSHSLKIYKVKVGEDVEMKVNFTAAPKPSDEWTVNTHLLKKSKRLIPSVDEESATLIIKKAEKNDAGNYTLKLTNDHGDATINIQLIIMHIPNPPSAPEPTHITHECITLEWNKPEIDGNSPITEYILEYREKEMTTWSKASEKIIESTYTIKKLKENSEYTFRTKAVNAIGPSDPSPNSKIIKTEQLRKQPMSIPDAPEGPLEVSGMTKTSFTIKWQAPKSDGGSPIIEYIVEIKETSQSTWRKIGTTKGETTHISVSDLKTDHSYDFRVSAKNIIGVGSPYVTEEPIIAGKRLTPPSPPVNVQVTNITSRSVTLEWSPPVSNGGAEITGYIVEKKPLIGKGSRWTKVVTLDGTINTYLLENLKESEFLFRIFAENSLGLSLPTMSEPVLLKSHASVPSQPTAPLEIRQIAGNTISIGWGRPEFDGGAPIDAYKIVIKDSKKTMWMEVGRVKADVQRLAIRDLQEGHEYLFRIYAKNEVGFSEPLESDEPIKILPVSELTVVEPITDEPDRGEITMSFSTENTSSWLREHNMDADIHSYARARLLRRDEYFFRIWHYAKKLFE